MCFGSPRLATLLEVAISTRPERRGSEASSVQHLGSDYREPRILYHNKGNGTFEDISASSGPGITTAASGRGLAVGDLWNDGRMPRSSAT